jgi:hypothetical protein
MHSKSITALDLYSMNSLERTLSTAQRLGWGRGFLHLGPLYANMPVRLVKPKIRTHPTLGMAARHALARAETPVSDSSPGTPDAMMGKYLRPQLRKSESMVQVRNGNRALLRRPRASMPTIRLTTSEQDEQTLFEDPMAIAVRCVRTTLGVESVCVAVVSLPPIGP